MNDQVNGLTTPEVIWRLPKSSNTRTRKVITEKYDTPVLTIMPTPEKGKSCQLHLNTAAVTALGITKEQRKINLGYRGTDVVFAANESGALKVTGANNISSKPWHEFICQLFTDSSTTVEPIEVNLTTDGEFLTCCFSDVIVVPTENVEVATPEVIIMDDANDLPFVVEETPELVNATEEVTSNENVTNW